MKNIFCWAGLFTLFFSVFVGAMVTMILYGIRSMVFIAIVAAMSSIVAWCVLRNNIEIYKADRVGLPKKSSTGMENENGRDT